jgi:small RNA 2'-O-methyltransferase
MFINFYSENKDLSWLLMKNPESIPLCKNIRKGAGIGWYDSPQSYNLAFFEGGKVVSFPKNEQETVSYMYEGEYCDPNCALSLITEFLRDVAAKDRSEKDVVCENKITINSIRLKRGKIIDALIRHFKDYEFKITPTESWENFVELEVSNHGYFQDLMCLVLTVLLLLSVDDGMFMTGKEDMIKKYLLIMNKVNAPYYIRFMLKVKCIHGKVFDKLKDLLNTDECSFVKGDTQQNRIDYVAQFINEGDTVVDWGCGSGQHSKRIAKVADQYIGFDINEDSLDRAKKKTQEIENISFFSADDDVDVSDVDVLVCSEVIEHMETPKAIEMINSLIKRFNPEKIVLTTPNKSFNVNYMLEEHETRFEDHVRELTEIEFEDFCGKLGDFNIQYSELGDKVNGVPCILGAFLERVQK